MGKEMPLSMLTSKGQTTIPKQVREALHLKAGDRIEFVIESEDRVVLRSASADISALDGLLDRSGQAPVSLEAMDAAVAAEAAALFEGEEG